LAYPDRIERAVLAEPDYYVPPIQRKHFPYGTRQINFAPDIGDIDFGAFVETPVAFVVGEKGDRTDLPEAEDYLRVLQSYAAEHRLTCRAELITVKDNGTSNATNFNAARSFLFGGAL
jgi:hypothetical protein